MTLNENHRRAILAAFHTIDKLLEDVENAKASTASPFSRIFNDLTPTQQQVIGDYVAGIRARMTDALKALATSVKPLGTAASWAIQTALAFAQITVQEIAPSRLKGYGPLDEEASILIERLNADLERSIRRLDTYLTAGLGKDLDILRLLYESGIPGMVVLSKSDLLSQADRTRMLEYVKGQIAKNLGLDLPVHAVSVVGAGAPLAHAWFASEIAPPCERAAELAEASGRRKLAALREGVAASLRTLLRERPETAAADTARERAEVERLALEAEGSIQETTRRCEGLLSETKDLARPTLELAAREIARHMSAGEEPSAASATVRQAITDTAASVRAKIQEDLLATRGRLRNALAEVARRLSIPVKPEELGIELVTQPTIAVPPEVDRADIRPPAWLSRLAPLSETRVRRRLLARLEEPLDGAYVSFSSQLRRWLTAALARLASQFAAQAEPLRAYARRAAEGGSGDPAGVAADLAEIEGSTEAVTADSATPGSVPA